MCGNTELTFPGHRNPYIEAQNDFLIPQLSLISTPPKNVPVKLSNPAVSLRTPLSSHLFISIHTATILFLPRCYVDGFPGLESVILLPKA